MKATGIVRRIDDLGRVVIPGGDPPQFTDPGRRTLADNMDTIRQVLLGYT